MAKNFSGSLDTRAARKKNIRLFITLAAGFFVCQPALAAQINVSIFDNYFTPFSPMVSPGDTVVWTNNGSLAHSVTGDDGSFDSGILAPGTTYSHAFNQTGVVSYYSKVDSLPSSQGGNKMNAVILVNGTAPAGGQNAATTTASGTANNFYFSTSTSTSFLNINQLQNQTTSTSSAGSAGFTGLSMPGGSGGAMGQSYSNTGVAQYVLWPSGSLVNISGTIYLLRGNSKIPFTNYSAFVGLGYSLANVVTTSDPLTGYTLSSYQIKTPKAAHPWGSWLLYQGTVYYSHQSGLIGVPSYDVFIAAGGKNNLILPANSYDVAVLKQNPNLPVLTAGDPRVVY